MIDLKDIQPDSPFLEQLALTGDGPVTLVNTFVAPPGEIPAVVEAWRRDSEIMKGRPGFVSAQLHQGVGTSHVLVNVAVWESADALREAFLHPSFQATLPLYPDGSVSYPVLTRTVAVPGICVA
ncbi:antibiotic biosynthesis monooxygenase family protein [Streptomyces sp. NPDC091281]|uniref:antibiotic biosynthesis monooxygenase family protein n=1 Tax=Streptomyces sp. NPDC091281 TaxID=3365985 RepID=UPI0037FDDFA8